MYRIEGFDVLTLFSRSPSLSRKSGRGSTWRFGWGGFEMLRAITSIRIRVSVRVRISIRMSKRVKTKM